MNSAERLHHQGRGSYRDSSTLNHMDHMSCNPSVPPPPPPAAAAAAAPPPDAAPPQTQPNLHDRYYGRYQQHQSTRSTKAYAYNSYHNSPVSPTNGEAIEDNLTSPLGIPALGMSTQRRAYRQRRKDPSCDACRERKVKCDATESTSCSECITRNVRCQFTKETNRRMTSIKQVQDLQNQLSEAKQTINQLQDTLQMRPSMSIENSSTQPVSFLESMNHLPRQRSSTLEDFEDARRWIKAACRGVYKIPALYQLETPSPLISTSEINLPSKKVTDMLLYQFNNYYNTHMPFMDWDNFTARVERCYYQGSFQGLPQIWVSSFFGVLACGTLQSTRKDEAGMNPSKDGLQYSVIATRLMNTFTDNLTLDHARTAILTGMFLTEQNMRSAGWVWMGLACRMLLDLGLHSESGVWSPEEREARQQVYWAIFSYDRLLTLLGQPLTLYEDDTEVPFVSSLGTSSFSFPRTMSFVVPIIRSIPQIRHTQRAASTKAISKRTLDTYDDFFASIVAGYPNILQPNNQTSSKYISALEPAMLHAVFPLLTARMMLCRRNLHHCCSDEERMSAMERLLTVALDTVDYIKRILVWRSSSAASVSLGGGSSSGCSSNSKSQTSSTVQDNCTEKEMESEVRSHSNNFIVLHVWRTTLILIAHSRLKEAEICVKLSQIIGDMRQINIACGRYLAAYLQRFTEVLKNSRQLEAGKRFLLTEEMIAWVSGDLQGDPDKAWIWTAATTNPTADQGQVEMQHNPKTYLLTESEKNDWGGWNRVLSILLEVESLTNVHVQSESHAESLVEWKASFPQTTKILPTPLTTTATATATAITTAELAAVATTTPPRHTSNPSNSSHSSYSSHESQPMKSPGSHSDHVDEMLHSRHSQNPLKRVLLGANVGSTGTLAPALRNTGAERMSIANII